MKRGEPPKRKTPLARGTVELKRSEIKRTKPVRRARPRINLARLQLEAETLSSALARAEGRRQKRCRNCDSTGPWERHHVVEAQEVKRLGLPLWNTMNILRLCVECHRKHTQHVALIPLVKLRNVNYQYAFMHMGSRAYNYMRRHYTGEDPRLDWWLGAYEHGRV